MNLQPRINNPTSVTRREVDAILARGWKPTIQFAQSGAPSRLLRDVNDLARHYGDRLEVRFYGHYGEVFDAAVLAHLPDVQHLSVDCLTHIRNARKIGDLAKLKKLSFGVFRDEDTAILEAFPLEQLTELFVSDNLRRNLDLTPLARARNLMELRVAGHMRGLPVVAGLPHLARLSLNAIAKRQDLTFLCDAPALRELSLILGGRPSLDEFRHPGLTDLSIIRVQGLVTLGDLSRFPCLKSLVIEDQIRLASLDLAGTALERLVLMNCKTLTSVPGLHAQERLREFRVARTDLDLDALLARDWPATMRILGLYSGSAKWNAAARAALDARGYKEVER
ncbi:hypothetical protein [Phenylobacterium sp.]|uniref:hypothetical protein n=1 Tax=Phenylobacterium sp. TaxID=1871053 RepID=UPI002EDB06D8